jgi:hypothetical protein
VVSDLSNNPGTISASEDNFADFARAQKRPFLIFQPDLHVAHRPADGLHARIAWNGWVGGMDGYRSRFAHGQALRDQCGIGQVNRNSCNIVAIDRFGHVPDEA